MYVHVACVCSILKINHTKSAKIVIGYLYNYTYFSHRNFGVQNKIMYTWSLSLFHWDIHKNAIVHNSF